MLWDFMKSLKILSYNVENSHPVTSGAKTKKTKTLAPSGKDGDDDFLSFIIMKVINQVQILVQLFHRSLRREFVTLYKLELIKEPV